MKTTNFCKRMGVGFFAYIVLVFAALMLLQSHAQASVSTANPHYANWSKHQAVIVKASVKAKVDPSNMAAVAFIESKFKGDTKRGLFQFEPATWRAMLKEFGPKYGLSRNTKMSNPMANALMSAELWKKNRGILTARLHRNVSPSEVYIAHFLGIGGALNMLKAKNNRLARDVTPMQAKHNRNHFYRNGKALTVAQFKAKMTSMMNAPKTTFGSEARARALMTYDYAYNYSTQNVRYN